MTEFSIFTFVFEIWLILADFLSPYFTIGILNNAGNPWEVFQGFILHVHVEGDIISRRYDRNTDIHFRLRDTADYVPHTLL